MKTSPERQIFITGFGGQGIVMAGNVLGKAATLYDGKHATMMQTYGPEARGGSCSSQVIISGSEILYPSIREPEVLVCMSQEGYTKNIKNLRRGGTLIWDTDLVKSRKTAAGRTTYNIPATRFAEELGNAMMANIVMLGFLAAVENIVSAGALRDAVADSIPQAMKESNLKAFDRGREYGEAILKGRAKQRRSGETS
ncbi:MAG TPA: 2-oxoacid:acceptor oxidoreductase family protein [Syntrophales bacterium]|nr:2-oxoacid:acceptor oxidoreductase family protein [Syntrophales bacterium]